jgi:hypothetical protein
MDSTMLNDNQARHLTSVLGLLLDDLAELGASLPPEPWADAARAQILEASARVRRLLSDLGLAPAERTEPGRRLLAYMGIWLSRLHDLRAEHLRGYGDVAHTLEATLNPGLDEISIQLQRLGRLAADGAGR